MYIAVSQRTPSDAFTWKCILKYIKKIKDSQTRSKVNYRAYLLQLPKHFQVLLKIINRSLEDCISRVYDS